MCRDTDIARGNLSDLKMGRTKELSAKNIKKIADYFGVSVDSLVSDLSSCDECEFTYTNSFDDFDAHNKRHEKWQKAKQKFGIWNHLERAKRHEYEQIAKDSSLPLDERIKAAENIIFAYFSRSVLNNDFSLSHIDYLSYIPYFLHSQPHVFTEDIREILVKKYGTKEGMTGTYFDIPDQKQNSINSESKINSNDDLKLALFGGDSEVTDEMWEEALFAAQLIKERYKRKKDKLD
jgi:transcriptional regulator with XRE-family HTH domain